MKEKYNIRLGKLQKKNRLYIANRDINLSRTYTKSEQMTTRTLIN
jgi:hypothetical protein